MRGKTQECQDVLPTQFCADGRSQLSTEPHQKVLTYLPCPPVLYGAGSVSLTFIHREKIVPMAGPVFVSQQNDETTASYAFALRKEPLAAGTDCSLPGALPEFQDLGAMSLSLRCPLPACPLTSLDRDVSCCARGATTEVSWMRLYRP